MARPKDSILNTYFNWTGITLSFPKKIFQMVILMCHRLSGLFKILLFFPSTPFSRGKTLISLWWDQVKQTKTTTKLRNNSHSYTNGQQDREPCSGNSHTEQIFRMTHNKYGSTRIFAGRNLTGYLKAFFPLFFPAGFIIPHCAPTTSREQCIPPCATASGLQCVCHLSGRFCKCNTAKIYRQMLSWVIRNKSPGLLINIKSPSGASGMW